MQMKQVLLAGLFLITMSSTTTLSAQKRYTLKESLDQKLVSVRVEASGGHRGQTLAMYIDRLTKKEIELVIEPGQFFLPSDSSLQTMINVHEEVIVLDEVKKIKRLHAFCAEATDGSPGAEKKFAVGEIAKGPLLQVARYISANKLHKSPDVQSAIWAITNDYPVATIAHRGLLEVACLALNLPIPEYSIVQDAPPEPIAGQPALHFKPMRVEGKFEYQASSPHTLNVYLLDAIGTRLRTLIPDRPYTQGIIWFTFKFETSQLASGTYRVCLDDGERVVKCIPIEYKSQ
jgi:hypothetical protein